MKNLRQMLFLRTCKKGQRDLKRESKLQPDEAGDVSGGQTCRVSWVMQGLDFYPKNSKKPYSALALWAGNPHWPESQTPYTHSHPGGTTHLCPVGTLHGESFQGEGEGRGGVGVP